MASGDIGGDTHPRRLYREPEDKKLSGVCSGLADYFGLDPTVVRLLAVVLALATGLGPIVIAYIVAALVIPVRPPDVPRVNPLSNTALANPRVNQGLIIAAVVLATLGFVGGWGWWINPPTVGLTLVALGVWLLMSRDQRPETPALFTTRSAGGTTLIGEAASERDQHEGVPVIEDAPSWSDDSAGPRGEVPPPVPPWGPTNFSPLGPPPEGTERPSAGPLLAAALITAGIISFLVVFDVWDLGFEETLGAALLVMGIVLVVGAWWGRSRWIAWIGVPAIALLWTADTVDLPIDGGTGDRTVRISTMAELRDLDTHHEMFAGELVIDLDQAPLGRPGAPTPTLSADVGMGSLVVYLPEAVSADLDIDVGMGNAQIEGYDDESGIDVDRSQVIQGDPGGGRINLELHVGMGEVQVFHG